MRTLKKALSLVLCVVMVMGLFAFSVSAKSVYDYTDSKDIKYTEAAEVLSALGVINGKDDGTYDPKGELTRGEAAIIITRLLNVNPAGKSTFTDIRDPFYDPYIGYLQGQGFVNGYGDGRFGPDDKLTGSAFGKMLLVALGYEAETENMTGVQWEIGVAKLLKSTNITGSIVPFDQSAIVTREVAAQMSLNALKADMVEYPSGGVQVTTTDGTEVKVNQGKAETRYNANTRYSHIKNDNQGTIASPYYKCQLGEDAWESLRLIQGNEKDDLGRPVNNWEYQGNTVVKAPKTPVASFYAGTSESAINDALRSYTIGVAVDGALVPYAKKNINSNTTLQKTDRLLCFDRENMKFASDFTDASNIDLFGVSYVKDGQKFDDGYGYVENLSSRTPGVESIAKRLAESLAKDAEGKLVEFYANDDNFITNIVTIEYRVAEVTRAETASNGDIIYTINGHTGRDYADPTMTDTIQVVGTLNVGDIVTVVRPGTSNETVSYVYPTEKVTGVQTAKDKSSKITVDGNVMTVGRGVWDIDNVKISESYATSDRFANGTASRNFYRDQFGYIVHADDGAAELTDYAVVGKISYTAESGLDSSTVKAVLYMVDGTSKTVTVDSINGIEIKNDNMNLGTKTDEPYDFYNVSAAALSLATGMTFDQVLALLDSTDDIDRAIEAGIKAPDSIVMYKTSDYNTAFIDKLVTFNVKSNGNYELNYGPRAQDYFAATQSNTSNTASKIYTKLGVAYEMTNKYEVVTKNAPTVRAYSIGSLTERGDFSSNENTVFIIRGKGTNTVNVYTGFRAVPTIRLSDGPANVSYVWDGGRARLVYINAVDQTITSSAKDIFFATTDNYVTDRSGGSTLYKLDGILNGEKTTLVTDKNDVFSADNGNFIKKGYLYRVEFTGNNYVDKMAKLITKKGVVATNAFVDGTAVTTNYDPDDTTKKILDAAGIANTENIKSISGGAFEGYTWTDSTKIVVVDDGNLIDNGDMRSLAAGDAWYIQVIGDNNADRYTIKQIYIDKNIGKTLDAADADSINSNLNDNTDITVGDTVYVYNDDPAIVVKDQQTLTLSGGLTDYGTTTRNVLTVDDGGTAIINGNVDANDGTIITVNGDLTINPSSSGEINAHFDVGATGTLTINYPSNVLTIGGSSIEVNAGGHATLKASNVIIKGSFYAEPNASATVYDVNLDTAVTINGNLTVDSNNVRVVGSTYAVYPTVHINGDLRVVSGRSVYVSGGDTAITFSGNYMTVPSATSMGGTITTPPTGIKKD